MTKKLFILSLLSIHLLASDIPMQSRELPTKEMKAQNKQITFMAAEELSKSLPQVVDKYTKLVGVQADGTTLIYIYEIDTTPKSDETVIKQDHSRMKAAVTKGTCQSSKRFLEADISIRYVYKSASTKAELFKFNINQESCFKLK